MNATHMTSCSRYAYLDMKRCGALEHEAWKNGSQPWMTKLFGPYDPAKPYNEIAAAMEMEKLTPLAQTLVHFEMPD